MNYSYWMWQMAAALLPWSWSLRHKQGSECSGWWTFGFNMPSLCKSYGVSQSSHRCLYLHHCNFLHREAVTSFGPHMSQTHVWDVMLVFVPWSQLILHLKASTGTEIPQLLYTGHPSAPQPALKLILILSRLSTKWNLKPLLTSQDPQKIIVDPLGFTTQFTEQQD